jgi:hypothetical protein
VVTTKEGHSIPSELQDFYSNILAIVSDHIQSFDVLVIIIHKVFFFFPNIITNGRSTRNFEMGLYLIYQATSIEVY